MPDLNRYGTPLARRACAAHAGLRRTRPTPPRRSHGVPQTHKDTTMPNHDAFDDVLHAVDAALKSDAMTSTPDAAEGEPGPQIVHMTARAAQLIDLRADDPGAQIAELLGVGVAEHVSFGLFDAVVAQTGPEAGPPNPGNMMLRKLLAHVVAGDVAASDRDRAVIGRMIATKTAPVLYGDVVLCGARDNVGHPTGLPESVVTWLLELSHSNAQLEAIEQALSAILASPIGPAIKAAMERGEVDVAVVDIQAVPPASDDD